HRGGAVEGDLQREAEPVEGPAEEQGVRGERDQQEDGDRPAQEPVREDLPAEPWVAQGVEEVAQEPLAAKPAGDHPRAALELLPDRARFGGLVDQRIVVDDCTVTLLHDPYALTDVAA